MFLKKLIYRFTSGKNVKLFYYAAAVTRHRLEPNWVYRNRLDAVLRRAKLRHDYDDILRRVDYYCKLPTDTTTVLPAEKSQCIGDLRPEKQKVYFYDTQRYVRWFAPTMRFGFHPGDVTYVPDAPAIVKSRPLPPPDDYMANANSVLMKLDRVRHFIFVNDRKPWVDKQNRAIFMGKANGKPERLLFLKMYFGSDLCHCGDVSRHAPKGHPEWKVPKMTIAQHLDYKFILALEGNDVASNLKWVMSSNSLAVMPRPTCETWFMEGLLEPNVHYVEIKPDFSDLAERMQYYIDHPAEAQAIIDNAHRWVDQFRDNKRENIISLLTLKKYFRATGQCD